MTNKDALKSIINYSSEYLRTNNITLEKRLEKITLSDKQYDEISAETNKNIATGAVKDLAKTFAPPIAYGLEFWNLNKKIDNDLNEAKKVILLTEYFNKSDRMDKAITNLKEAMTNMYGNTLINKVLQMVDNYPPDEKLMTYLVSTLKHIVDSKEFEKLFDQHKFNLSLIDGMSPQSLAILADNKNWPQFKFNFTGVSIGSKIEGTFEKPFITAYFKMKNISDKEKQTRAIHAIYELNSQKFIECHSKNNKFQLLLTSTGRELSKYLMV